MFITDHLQKECWVAKYNRTLSVKNGKIYRIIALVTSNKKFLVFVKKKKKTSLTSRSCKQS